MDYPEEIISQSNYKERMILSELDKKFYLCYRLKGSLESHYEPGGLFHGRHKLKEDTFEYPVHMSLNILGGHFKPEHIRFNPKKPGCAKWSKEKGYDKDECLASFETLNEVTPVFYKAKTLSGHEFDVDVTFEDSAAYKACRDALKDSGAVKEWPEYKETADITIHTRCDIVHDPTNLNYWHSQMELYPGDSMVELKNANGSWRSRIFEHIVSNRLCYRYEAQMSETYPDIPERLYKDVI